MEELDADPQGLRIAVTTETLIDEETHPDCVAAVQSAARLLESLGHTTDEPNLDAFQGFDLLNTFLVRWASGQAALMNQLAMIVGREITADDVEPLTWALVERGRALTAPEYLGAVSVHQVTGRLWAGMYESGFDLMMVPTLGEPPPPLGTFDDSGPDPFKAFERAFITGTFTAPFNATGQPAISLPLHWNEAGLPIGVQLVAPMGREDLLIAVGAQLERAQPWADRRPPVFAGSTASATS
jgi:amidase